MNQFKRRVFENQVSNYFNGWERFGIKEEDGLISEFTPPEMPTVRLTLRENDDVYIGPAEDVRDYYTFHDNLTKADLDQHKDVSGWKPGRMVVETSPGSYQVWVRYDDKVKNAGQTWGLIATNSQVIHYDEKEGTEKVKRSHKMEPILKKLGRYFEEYEFGVYREADEKKEAAVWAVKPEPGNDKIGYLKAMNAQGKHIFIRPSFDQEPFFMMHDDLDEKGLQKHHKDSSGHWKPGRLVVESSPGNFQVWIKSTRALSNEEKKYWLDKMDSDPGASPLHRWGRSPGFRNRKSKYQNEKGYPLARLHHIDWDRLAHVPEIAIEKQAETKQTAPSFKHPKNHLRLIICRDDYYKGVDKNGKVRESEQDFAYALALLRRGVPRHEVEERIIVEREEWGNHTGEKRQRSYLTKTLDKAEAIINNSTYSVTVKNKKLNFSRTETFENVKKDEAKKVLSQEAKNMAVQIGFDSINDVQIDIEKIDRVKKNGKDMSARLEINKEPEGVL